MNRDPTTTQAWARRIFQDRFAGTSWWPFCGPQWASFGLWDWSRLEVAEPPRPLFLTDPVVVRAAAVITRPILPR